MGGVRLKEQCVVSEKTTQKEEERRLTQKAAHLIVTEKFPEELFRNNHNHQEKGTGNQKGRPWR